MLITTLSKPPTVIARAVRLVAISTWTTGDPHVATLLGNDGPGNRLHMGSGGFYGFLWGDLGR